MSQIKRRFASFFVVFAAVVVYQFSLILAVAILVVAVFLYQGFQMSDLTINVPSSSRANSLLSSLYSWTESAVSSVAKKCKNLTASGTENNARLPIQGPIGSGKKSTQHTYSPGFDCASFGNRENIYQGTSIHQSPKVSDSAPRASPSCSSVDTSEWNRKTPIASSATLNKSLTATSRYDNDSFSQRSSPWGYSLSPQQRSSVSNTRTVTAAPSPLSASSRYNSRDAALFVDVNSPGFSSRLLKYHSEAAIHQPQYTRPGQLPLVHLSSSPLPTLSARNSQKVRSPVRVRIAPPTYDSPESRLFARPEKQPLPEQQSKSVIEVLKEISRKRIHTEDGGSDAKRHHPQSDSSSSSSSSSTPAMVNGVLLEPGPTGKRPREEDSPKLQKPSVKRTRNNEIYSSLSSSRNINVGTKRKAADSWSRCSTPAPIGKHLKKSPHIASNVSDNDDNRSIEEHTPQREPSPLPKPAPERKSPLMVGQTPSPSVNIARSVDAQSSSHHSLESINETAESSKSQLARSQHHGRLFVKAFSRGIASETEGMKDSRKNGGTKPWKTQRTIDADAITGEDIVGQDMEIGSRRLNSMFSVLESKGPTPNDQPKGDVVDGGPSKVDASKLSSNTTESEKNGLTAGLAAKTLPTPSQVEQPLPTSTPASSSENVSEGPAKEVPSASKSQPTPTPTFGSLQNPLPSSNPPFVEKEKSSPTPPTTQPPPAVNFSSGSSVPATSSTSLPFTSITPTSNASVLTQPSTTSSPTTATETLSRAITSAATTIPSGIFGSPSTATFTVPQQSEKPPATTASTFTFGASTTTGVSSTAVSSSGFGLPSYPTTSTPAVTTQSLPSVTPSFGVLSRSSSTTVPTSVTDTKSNAPTSTSGGFSFGASSSVVSQAPSLGGFSMPKTTASSGISFGVSSSAPSISTFVPASTVSSSQNAPSAVTTTTDSSAPKPFGFGASTQQDSTQTSSATSSTGGFNFQFGSSASSTLAAPKPQDSSSGFKFSFGASKGEGGLSTPQQSTNPIAKPPAFGEGFAFGATPTNTSNVEPKPMAFGTPTSLTPTMTAPSAAPPPSGGFNFTANADASSSTLKPSFGFGTSNVGGATTGSVLGSSGGGFNFGAKPADPPSVAPAQAAPSLGSPFQFGANSQVMPSSSTLQPQAQTVNSPFSIGGATEQKPPALSGGFSFGSTPSSNLQQSAPAFGQSSGPSFGSPSINPLQSQQPAPAPSLFQFGSGGSNMSQPANPMQPGMGAPAMFSIGSGSTAPRSRPRNRRQK
ncbi:mucin-17 isoform X2 [Ischnura elegans]|uniref:mucin-17 isoform X2 n=1 Tax=Ischnura elegans TaxID=197161 RepID=UPI001ED8AE53|nr:mucin-17 isoform X2 [Ischnura elegans]